MTLFERLNVFCAAHKVGTKDLASILELSDRSVQSIKSGARGLTLANLQKILEVYPKLSAEWLLRGEGEMYKTEKPQNIIVGNNGIVGNNNSGNSVNVGSNADVQPVEGQIPCGLSLKYNNMEIPMEKIVELFKSIKL